MKKTWLIPIALGILIGFVAFALYAIPVYASPRLDQTDEEVAKTTPAIKEALPPMNQTASLDTTLSQNDTELDEDENNGEIVINDEVDITNLPENIEPVVDEKKEESSDKMEEDSNKEEEHHGCKHFWRREYFPETATEDGCIMDSCLYCGDWYIVETIPARNK